MPLFRLDHLTKQFGRRRVVDDVSLEMEAGEVVGLLGPNGAGKTTTFRIAMGIFPPTRGRVFLNEKDVTRLPMYLRARRGMGFLPQEKSVFQRLTVEQNLLAILEALGVRRKERIRRCEALLTEYGLVTVRKQPAYTLSGGETRRLEICRALLTQPLLLLLDEPFSGVDPIAVADIQEFIRRLKGQGIGILLTDHNVRETLAITDRSYIIKEGAIFAQGTREQIVGNPDVRRGYLGEGFRM